jgi:hypothetical protein
MPPLELRRRMADRTLVRETVFDTERSLMENIECFDGEAKESSC